MIKNGSGGMNTNKNGLQFENNFNLLSYLKQHYTVHIINKNLYEIIDCNGNIYYYALKNGFYNFIENYLNINYKKRLSKKIIPDFCIISLKHNIFHFFEIKYQETSGSTDEKIQTCDCKVFKLNKLLLGLNFSLSYNYIFNDWFKQPRYNDDLEYIHIVGCNYYFNQIPLDTIFH